MSARTAPRLACALAAGVALTTLAASAVSCRATEAPPTRVTRAPGPDARPAPRAVRHRFTGTAMGCVVAITIDDDDASRARDAARAGLLELDRLDAMYSDWKRASELTRLNGDASPRAEISGEFASLLRRALEVSAASDGLFDPTVGTLVACWRDSRRSGRLPAPADLEAARARSGWRAIRVVGATTVERATHGLRLDFGGIAKGEGAVRALAAIEAGGCPRALVAVAGDIACGDAPRGEAGWTVEIAGEPRAGDARATTTDARPPLVLARRAVSTSGGSMQWTEIDGVRYAHIVDPRTGLGATKPAQATVIGPLDASVDALGTALALTDDDAQAIAILARFPGHEAILERDGVTRRLPPTPAADGLR